jgi:hypothetical protein
MMKGLCMLLVGGLLLAGCGGGSSNPGTTPASKAKSSASSSSNSRSSSNNQSSTTSSSSLPQSSESQSIQSSTSSSAVTSSLSSNSSSSSVIIAAVTLTGRNDGIGADLVIIAEGFTAEEMNKFHAASNNYIEYMFSYDPAFAVQKKAWNIHRIDLVSPESGADNTDGDNTNKVNTALDAFFYCAGTERLLCVDTAKTILAVNSQFPQWDNILVIVNSIKYGGAGYGNGIGTASLNELAKDVALHEMGHSFAGLADEYDYGGTTAPTIEPLEPNVTINNNINTVKWKHWAGTGTGDGFIGLFVGGAYVAQGVWRPTFNTFMRGIGAPFYAVNLEAWTLSLYVHSKPALSFTPETATTQTAGNNTQFTVDTAMATGAQQLRWKINDQAHSEFDDMTQITWGAQETGNYTVTLDISDKTGVIREDINNYSSQQINWQITLN